MKKLNLVQIMTLADKLKDTEWITVLISLNNSNQIDFFFDLIKRSDALNEILKETKKCNVRQ